MEKSLSFCFLIPVLLHIGFQFPDIPPHFAGKISIRGLSTINVKFRFDIVNIVQQIFIRN